MLKPRSQPTDINAETIRQLRAEFGAITTIDPSGPIYKKLIEILDRADDNALKAVFDAKIPFASNLALNRMIRRGLINFAA